MTVDPYNKIYILESPSLQERPTIFFSNKQSRVRSSDQSWVHIVCLGSRVLCINRLAPPRRRMTLHLFRLQVFFTRPQHPQKRKKRKKCPILPTLNPNKSLAPSKLALEAYMLCSWIKGIILECLIQGWNTFPGHPHLQKLEGFWKRWWPGKHVSSVF